MRHSEFKRSVLHGVFGAFVGFAMAAMLMDGFPVGEAIAKGPPAPTLVSVAVWKDAVVRGWSDGLVEVCEVVADPRVTRPSRGGCSAGVPAVRQ